MAQGLAKQALLWYNKSMEQTIIHVDMDAFFAAVEVRDNPELRGKPLIIGALPSERGVVATCSYEARKFGVRSAMNIKEAYRLCPHGIYMHPSRHKYKESSDRIREIWNTYTDLIEYISLDEGFLDVTKSARVFGGARAVAMQIKKRTLEKIGLTCSVGIGYSMTAAKLASEEKKPDGFFEILTPQALVELIIDRPVRIVYGVGPKTAETLQAIGIKTVRDILANKPAVIQLLGNMGHHIIDLAEGIDPRQVTPHFESESKSQGREHTFQHDTDDFEYLKDVLRLIAKDLSLKIRLEGIFARTVTLKVKYTDMRQITRAKSGDTVYRARDIYNIAAALLDGIEHRPVRLVGITLSGFSDSDMKQFTLEDVANPHEDERRAALDDALLKLQRKFGSSIIKTGDELIAEQRFGSDDIRDE